MHTLPGYAPDLNPDELVWSYVKRTGVARKPLRAGEKLQIRVDTQLRKVQRDPRLIRSFFGAPSVSYISDYCVRCERADQRHQLGPRHHPVHLV